jgi:hypothetical protein
MRSSKQPRGEEDPAGLKPQQYVAEESERHELLKKEQREKRRSTVQIDSALSRRLQQLTRLQEGM